METADDVHHQPKISVFDNVEMWLNNQLSLVLGSPQ